MNNLNELEAQLNKNEEEINLNNDKEQNNNQNKNIELMKILNSNNNDDSTKQLTICHLFLDTQQTDVNEIRKYILSNDYDQITIKKLLSKVFINSPCKCEIDNNNNSNECMKHEITLSISELIDYLDIKEESILTLLCYLENKNYIKLLPNCYKYCIIKCYNGIQHLKQLSSNNELLKKIFALINTNGQLNSNNYINNDDDNLLKFDLVKLCSNEKWDVDIVRTQLKSLEWQLKSSGGSVKTSIKIEFDNLSFHLKHKCIDNDEQFDDIFDYLWLHVNTLQTQLKLNFQTLYKILTQNAFNSIKQLCYDYKLNYKINLLKNNLNIKQSINSYFKNQLDLNEFCFNFKFDYEQLNDSTSNSINTLANKDKDVLIKNIRKFINLYSNDFKINGRLIARIFHGISTPKFSSEIWSRNRQFWRCGLNFDFEYIIQIATNELINNN